MNNLRPLSEAATHEAIRTLGVAAAMLDNQIDIVELEIAEGRLTGSQLDFSESNATDLQIALQGVRDVSALLEQTLI